MNVIWSLFTIALPCFIAGFFVGRLFFLLKQIEELEDLKRKVDVLNSMRKEIKS